MEVSWSTKPGSITSVLKGCRNPLLSKPSFGRIERDFRMELRNLSGNYWRSVNLKKCFILRPILKRHSNTRCFALLSTDKRDRTESFYLFFVLWSVSSKERRAEQSAYDCSNKRFCGSDVTEYSANSVVVSFAAVIRVVTQRSSPLTAAHERDAFLSLCF